MRQSKTVFVFGSNTAGKHGKGAALAAKRFHGAIEGRGEGEQGNAYAIPTKDYQLRPRELSDIAASVERFCKYAASNPDVHFQVTRVGCGLAGFADDQIYPLFAEHAPKNCYLPGVWLQRRRPELMRVIVAGGRTFGNKDGQVEAMHEDLDRLHAKYPQVRIVSGMAKGADSHGHAWAKSRKVPVAEFPADWDNMGKVAGFVRNERMAWYGTHLIAYWDGKSKGTGHMVKIAKANGLPTWVRPG